MGVANLFARQRCYYIFFHLVLQLLAILVVVIVIRLLLCPLQRYRDSVQGELAHVCLPRFDL